VDEFQLIALDALFILWTPRDLLQELLPWGAPPCANVLWKLHSRTYNYMHILM